MKWTLIFKSQKNYRKVKDYNFYQNLKLIRLEKGTSDIFATITKVDY